MPLTAYLKHLRWDSSDPDRAPPPLPLNPGSPNLSTRANTSANIVAAAQVLQDKARESAGPSPYTTNPMPNAQKSPERSLIKGGGSSSTSSAAAAAQKRLQSLSTPSVRDLRCYLDGARTPTERSPERRTGTPTRHRRDSERGGDFHIMGNGGGSLEKAGQRQSTPTPMPSGRDILKEGSALLKHGGNKGTSKALLGENIPPGAANASSMMALQTIPSKEMDSTFGTLKNMSGAVTSTTTTTTSDSKTTPTFDVISSQIMSLTNIATNLQREMSQLSRRSKDNASDLISLKEATHRRDEDIRLSLRELVASVADVPHHHHHQHLLTAPSASHSLTRPASTISFQSPPSAGKTVSLPRIPSPNSFLMDDRVGSPSPYSVEGAASVAMLEKIIREMVTKDGQERLLSNLSQLLDKYGKESVDKSASTAQKVEELADFIKSQSQALVHRNNGGGRFIDENGASALPFHDMQAGPLAKISRELNASSNAGGSHSGADGQKPFSSPKAADFVSAEMLKLLKKIKDSVAESGGMTAEVKALVRDLRSEVLGMGRELGRKIDEADRSSHHEQSRGQAERDLMSREDQTNEVARIVQEGLEEMREHMEHVIRENRRQSSSSIVSRNAVDSQEVYGVVKHALAEHDFSYGSGALQAHPGTPATGAELVQKEEILAAVKEAYETYKPEIELQQFGLERDEILQCLREGLEDYRNSAREHLDRGADHGISRDEIMDAVQEAMQNFTPPAPVSEAHEIREEVLLAVRECLEDYKPPAAAPAEFNGASSRDIQSTTEAVLDAVRDGFAMHGPAAPRELEISREDLFEAVKAGLEQSSEPLGPNGEQILSPLHGLVEEMRVEFKQYSAANGRDTEQVLDAVKDGLESLRAGIES